MPSTILAKPLVSLVRHSVSGLVCNVKNMWAYFPGGFLFFQKGFVFVKEKGGKIDGVKLMWGFFQKQLLCIKADSFNYFTLFLDILNNFFLSAATSVASSQWTMIP